MGNNFKETFPYYSQDGYFSSGSWKAIRFGNIYRNTRGMPPWEKESKKNFIRHFHRGGERGQKVGDGKKCWFYCTMKFEYSAN